jgi:hypothetical protein
LKSKGFVCFTERIVEDTQLWLGWFGVGNGMTRLFVCLFGMQLLLEMANCVMPRHNVLGLGDIND